MGNLEFGNACKEIAEVGKCLQADGKMWRWEMWRWDNVEMGKHVQGDGKGLNVCKEVTEVGGWKKGARKGFVPMPAL